MFEVHIQAPNRESRKVKCLHNECGIGRGDSNLVVLQGWTIGTNHASLSLNERGVFIEHLGGRAAVTVNGTRIKHPHGPLDNRDLIQIGDYSLRVLSEATERRDTTPAAANDDAGSDHQRNVDDKTSEHEGDGPTAAARMQEMVDWRSRIHTALVKQMDLRRVDVTGMSDNVLRDSTIALIREILDKEGPNIPEGMDRERLAKEVLDEAVGLGPLEDLLEDESVSEVMVNNYDDIFIERAGRIERSKVVFTSAKAVMSAIERIVAPLGRRIDESSPMVDARLKDGSRVNAIIPPIALRGPSLSIRKFAKNRLYGEDLLKFGSLNQGMLDFLEVAVRERRNIVVTGGTGSGKTTLLNILSNFIPDTDRIVTIEDAAELQLTQPNLVSLEARPANLEGKGQVTIRDLVKNSLRMRPDRIVVGECRGGETLDMLQAMNTGHEGSLTTAHANSPRDALSRMEVMVLMSSMDLPMMVVREQISSAVDLIIHQRRFPCGSRKVTHISEITGVESGTIQLQDLFLFRSRSASGPDGRVVGDFAATGAVPEFYEELAERGVPVDLNIFRAPEA